MEIVFSLIFGNNCRARQPSRRVGVLASVCKEKVFFLHPSLGRVAYKCVIIAIMSVVCFQHANAQSGSIVGTEYQFGPLLRENFVEPPKRIEPSFLTTSPNEARKNIVDEEVRNRGFSLALTANYPLHTNNGSGNGLGSQGEPAVSPTLQLGIKYNPIDYWFGQITFYRYLFADRQQAWNPDFGYSFGYDDWHSDTFSLVYSNYTGNRFSPDSANNEKRTNFNQGDWSLGYKFALPQMLEPLFLVGDGDQVGCNTSLNITPRYTNVSTLSTQSYKRTVALGCRYSRPSGWYATITLFAYPTKSQQQPWDPDFSYGFGYFDPRPGGFSIQYNNYSGNRFPGHALQGDGSLRKGGISISWSAQW